MTSLGTAKAFRINMKVSSSSTVFFFFFIIGMAGSVNWLGVDGMLLRGYHREIFQEKKAFCFY